MSQALPAISPGTALAPVHGFPVSREWRDPRDLQVHRPQARRDVPYVPTDDAVVSAMLDLANVTDRDVFYDLGCGDGRIVHAAAKRGARAVGVDIDLQRIHECQENSKRLGLTRRATFLHKSFFDVDLSEATVVTLYLLPSINLKLRPKLLWELRPGARVVSNNFDMKEWPADATATMNYRTLYKWTIPAWVQGRWSCVVDESDGTGRGRRWRLGLRFDRHFQRMRGSAFVGGKEITLAEGRICGHQVSFTLWHAQHFLPAMHFIGHVRGSTLRGTCRTKSADGLDGPAMAWGGVRR
jgi:precorrin-6B methylase 2